MRRRGDKPNKQQPVNKLDKYFSVVGFISIVLVFCGFAYILYYLYIVSITGQGATSTVFTSVTEYVSKVFQLFFSE